MLFPLLRKFFSFFILHSSCLEDAADLHLCKTFPSHFSFHSHFAHYFVTVYFKVIISLVSASVLSSLFLPSDIEGRGHMSSPVTGMLPSMWQVVSICLMKEWTSHKLPVRVFPNKHRFSFFRTLEYILNKVCISYMSSFL